MITSFNFLFWFFTALGIAYFIDRSKIIRKSWPEGFDLKSNTSYPVGTELRVSTIEKELRDWIGREPDMVGQYFLDNNQITSVDIVISKKSTEFINIGELFSVKIDAPLLKLEINGSEDRFKDVMNRG
jgi:hypothetical protein